MDAVCVFPLWIFDFFLCNVLFNAVEYVSGVCGRERSERRCNIAVDVSAALALGVSWYAVFRWCCTVCLWILQRYAYLHSTGVCYNAVIQTPFLVRILSDGNDDAADLQSGTCRIIRKALIHTGVFYPKSECLSGKPLRYLRWQSILTFWKQPHGQIPYNGQSVRVPVGFGLCHDKTPFTLQLLVRDQALALTDAVITSFLSNGQK